MPDHAVKLSKKSFKKTHWPPELRMEMVHLSEYNDQDGMDDPGFESDHAQAIFLSPLKRQVSYSMGTGVLSIYRL